jgi:hypothetical protein
MAPQPLQGPSRRPAAPARGVSAPGLSSTRGGTAVGASRFRARGGPQPPAERRDRRAAVEPPAPHAPGVFMGDLRSA